MCGRFQSVYVVCARVRVRTCLDVATPTERFQLRLLTLIIINDELLVIIIIINNLLFGRNDQIQLTMEGKPDLAELENEVITNNWYSLGLQLKLEETDLDAIEKESTNNIQTCRRRMFSKWLNTVLHASRKQLLDALRTTAVAEIALAEKYETFILRKYHLSSMESQPKLCKWAKHV